MNNENGIVCEKGEYKDFTGIILWGDNEGVVENACFKLDLEVRSGFKFVTFHSGIWKNGIWENGFWLNGTWKNGIWKDGTWLNGTWENGGWHRGNWHNGLWLNGADKQGKDSLDNPNLWKRGKIK